MAAGTTIFPILQAVLSRRTERESQGALQGSMSSITAVASIVSPLVMTQLFKAFVGSDPIFGSVSWPGAPFRSEEHTSELQSLMRISYAVFCLKKKKKDDMRQHPNKICHNRHTNVERMTQSIYKNKSN